MINFIYFTIFNILKVLIKTNFKERKTKQLTILKSKFTRELQFNRIIECFTKFESKYLDFLKQKLIRID
jgi:hypothetical protein